MDDGRLREGNFLHPKYEMRKINIYVIMLILVISALLAEFAVMWRRSAYYSSRAAWHRGEYDTFDLNTSQLLHNYRRFHKSDRLTGHYLDKFHQLFFASMREKMLYEKYVRAAKFPWLFIESDDDTRRRADELSRREKDAW